ncbi:MerR family transcriptional regulator [Anaerorhabdus sp.]|uniref:MerR family transcriptional regulator n=1 Tax=Anaerorhabdus sp. TaxID=1872524 RepID=UPI002FC86BB0
MNAKEIASLIGCSVRTLHHYDQIGLLTPHRNGLNGYREYSEEDIDRLQQILFFRQCGFTLSKIKELLNNSNFNRMEAYEIQRKALEYEKMRIERMLKLLDKTLSSTKQGGKLTMKEKLQDFDLNNNPYEEEAIRIWGKAKVEESKRFIADKSSKEQDAITEGMDRLFKDLALVSKEMPESIVAQEAMEKMYTYMNANFGYHYSYEAFGNLGKMYIEDERFTKNVDKYGEGLSLFLSEAMRIYADNKQK